MKVRLLAEALVKFLLGIALVALLVFLPAGSFSFSGGWLFMGVLFIPMLIVGIVMMAKNPDLLRKRLDAKEKQREQSLIVKLSGLMFLAGFVIAGLGHRFGWYTLPETVSLIASAVFLLSYVLYAEVLRENTYLSRTVEVQEGQKVIDTGLYGIIRHPMYTATVIMFMSVPLILGSVYSFVIFLFYPVLIAGRIKNEERLLERELSGYTEYKKKVRYRLIPFIW
ncbi:MAG: isoprenylcysteine carboxylmethyltransferase family protein [Clostridia bacterium]|nr:isoprenylcysteine carboxylmethyltransferase family protein [Clostridia bacterium]